MATLLQRCQRNHSCLYRPQKPGVLYDYQATQSTTGAMVWIPSRLWLQYHLPTRCTRHKAWCTHLKTWLSSTRERLQPYYCCQSSEFPDSPSTWIVLGYCHNQTRSVGNIFSHQVIVEKRSRNWWISKTILGQSQSSLWSSPIYSRQWRTPQIWQIILCPSHKWTMHPRHERMPWCTH